MKINLQPLPPRSVKDRAIKINLAHTSLVTTGCHLIKVEIGSFTYSTETLNIHTTDAILGGVDNEKVTQFFLLKGS